MAGCRREQWCRGRRDVLPGVFALAYGELTAWAFDVLGAGSVVGRVFEDNPRVVELLEKHGFERVRRVAMERVEDPDGVRWVEAPGHEPASAEKVLVEYIRYRK